MQGIGPMQILCFHVNSININLDANADVNVDIDTQCEQGLSVTPFFVSAKIERIFCENSTAFSVFHADCDNVTMKQKEQKTQN